MKMMQSIGHGAGIFLLFSGAAFSSEGGKDVPSEVGVSFTQVGLERDMWFDGEKSPLEWRCRAVLFIPDRWGFWNPSNTERQFMEAVDSTGRELSPVRFDLGRMDQSRDRGISYMEIEGFAPSLPSPVAEWVRLKGLLRVPVALIMDSPVYVLPLRKGASVLIPLPGNEKGNTGKLEDVVASDDMPMGMLYFKDFTWTRKDGKKTFSVTVCLDVDTPFYLDEFQLLDEKGKLLSAGMDSYSSSGNDNSIIWETALEFSVAKEMGNIGIRLRYRGEPEHVSVPVDVKLGMGGEIRKEPEKREERRNG